MSEQSAGADRTNFSITPKPLMPKPMRSKESVRDRRRLVSPSLAPVALILAAVCLLGAPRLTFGQAAKVPAASLDAVENGAIRFGEASFLNVGSDDTEDVMQIVRLPVLGTAGETMNKDALKVNVRFVECTGYDTDVKINMVGDDATVKYVWQAEPVDWVEGSEELEVRCKYLGMGEIIGVIATLEYQGKLQDALLTGRSDDNLGLAQQLSIMLANQQCKKLLNLTPFGNTETFVETYPVLTDGRYNWTAMKGAGSGDLTVKVSFDPTGHTPMINVRQDVSGVNSTIDTKVVSTPITAELKPRAQQDADIKPPAIMDE